MHFSLSEVSLYGKKTMPKIWLKIAGKIGTLFSRDSTRSYVRMYVRRTKGPIFGGKPKLRLAQNFNWLGPWLFSDSGRSAGHSFAMNP